MSERAPMRVFASMPTSTGADRADAADAMTAVAAAWAVGVRVRLSAEESRYLLRVRRARIGAPVELLDGVATCWHAVLVAADERAAVLELRAPRAAVAVVPLVLLLVVPEPRATLEALTLASELAASEVLLVEGDHSPAGLPSPERIARTLQAAQRQCGRDRPPRVERAASLAAALEHTAGRPGWVASVPERRLATPVEVAPGTGARLLVGPEGGLSAAEDALAVQAGLRPLALGPWVLRTPSAVAAGLARLLTSVGDQCG
jgi:16S rRNA (uracil1498-N3)-methyltransferase